MAFETISDGLTLVIPTSGTKNWASTLKTSTWKKISGHNHTGGGNGVKLTTSSLSLENFYGTQQNGSIIANTCTVNWNNGTIVVIDATAQTANTAISLASANPLTGRSYKMILKGAASPYLFTLAGATVKWQGGVSPFGADYYLTQSAGAIDIIDLYYDGTAYYAQWLSDFS